MQILYEKINIGFLLLFFNYLSTLKTKNVDIKNNSMCSTISKLLQKSTNRQKNTDKFFD